MGVVVPKTAVTRRNVEGAAGREGWRNVEGGGEEVRACVGRVYRPVKERMRRGKRLVGWRSGGGGVGAKVVWREWVHPNRNRPRPSIQEYAQKHDYE